MRPKKIHEVCDDVHENQYTIIQGHDFSYAFPSFVWV
jgi:hypothetical protein